MDDTSYAGFRRAWTCPKRVWRGGTLTHFSARGLYLMEQSRQRFLCRPDAYLPSTLPLTGEIGRIESFRFILSPRTTP